MRGKPITRQQPSVDCLGQDCHQDTTLGNAVFQSLQILIDLNTAKTVHAANQNSYTVGKLTLGEFVRCHERGT